MDLDLREEFEIRRFTISLIALILIAGSLVLLTAIACDLFDVYLPGIGYLIPSHIQRQHNQRVKPVVTPTYIEEEVIVIDKSDDSR